jgi:REP element-mobilizing transposase RayT
VARRPRNETEAGVHHVYARGVERRAIFVDEDDWRLYLRLLRAVVERFRWHVLGYCLMPNHVHLLVETRAPNLGKGMHMLHGLYAQLFNERYERVGHLFQSRFGNREVHDELGLAAVLGYIALNPVAAGLCDSPGDWPWSSHREMTSAFAPSLIDVNRLRMHLAPIDDLPARYDALIDERLGDERLSDEPRGRA